MHYSSLADLVLTPRPLPKTFCVLKYSTAARVQRLFKSANLLCVILQAKINVRRLKHLAQDAIPQVCHLKTT